MLIIEVNNICSQPGGGGAFCMYCTQNLLNCCYVLKKMGVTNSIDHKDGS